MKTIFKYIRPKLASMSAQMFIKFLGTVVELLLPWMLSVILDEIVPAGKRDMIWLWGALMALCSVIALAANAIANSWACSISKDIIINVRHDLFVRITGLSARQEDYFTTPSLISRLSSDTYNLHQMIDRMQRLGVRAPILMLGGIVITFNLEPVLTAVLFSTLPLLAIVIVLVSRFGVKMYMQAQALLDALVHSAQEGMAGIRVIQALSKTDYEVNKFDKANREVIQKEIKTETLMNITNPTISFLLNAGLTAVIVAGAFRVNDGVTKPGMIIAFLSYFTIILNALMMVTRLFIMYSRGAASANRIAEVLDSSIEMEAQPIEAGDSINRDDVHIRFENVTFSYNKVRNNLTNINFSLKRGETLGVIGPTGSGKSTLLNLVLRFYDPDSGCVYINGRNIKNIPHGLLHNMFGVVFQSDFLFAGEISENIGFGRELGENKLADAANIAQADFVFDSKDGFAAQIASKGSNISGGQKQRLLLARALAAAPEIILLDDSSSALDYKTDAKIREQLAKRFTTSTKIIIAQRISAIRDADHIIVLEDGCVIGGGRHDELIESCESYRDIAKIQMG
ncbi:MAG: ABC transporter ATP-binding protein/permease [Clostridiales bacterium]|jgi:ATP-binding cassette subfamily B protein|nr:ABC transporter ATP-binding protein/permease [Clostridiales bacterium]